MFQAIPNRDPYSPRTGFFSLVVRFYHTDEALTLTLYSIRIPSRVSFLKWHASAFKLDVSKITISVEYMTLGFFYIYCFTLPSQRIGLHN